MGQRFASLAYDLILIASIGDSDVFWRNQSGLTRSFNIFSQAADDVGEATHSLQQNSMKCLVLLRFKYHKEALSQQTESRSQFR